MFCRLVPSRAFLLSEERCQWECRKIQCGASLVPLLTGCVQPPQIKSDIDVYPSKWKTIKERSSFRGLTTKLIIDESSFH